MAMLSIEQTYQLLRDAGFNPIAAAQMTAIARAESGLRTDAVGDVNLQTPKWGPSVGLFQVRTLRSQTGTGGERDQAALMASPAAQARAAYEISNGGRNFRPWTTWTSGSAARELPRVYTGLGVRPGQGLPDAVDAPPLPAPSPVSPDPSTTAAGDTSTPAGWKPKLPDLPNPLDGKWVGDLSDTLRKLTITGVALSAGAALLVVGFSRLVAPTINRAVESAL